MKSSGTDRRYDQSGRPRYGLGATAYNGGNALHALCHNPLCTLELLQAVSKFCPEAARGLTTEIGSDPVVPQRGGLFGGGGAAATTIGYYSDDDFVAGKTPLHVLAHNPTATAAMLEELLSMWPAAGQVQDCVGRTATYVVCAGDAAPHPMQNQFGAPAQFGAGFRAGAGGPAGDHAEAVLGVSAEKLRVLATANPASFGLVTARPTKLKLFGHRAASDCASDCVEGQPWGCNPVHVLCGNRHITPAMIEIAGKACPAAWQVVVGGDAPAPATATNFALGGGFGGPQPMGAASSARPLDTPLHILCRLPQATSELFTAALMLWPEAAEKLNEAQSTPFHILLEKVEQRGQQLHASQPQHFGAGAKHAGFGGFGAAPQMTSVFGAPLHQSPQQRAHDDATHAYVDKSLLSGGLASIARLYPVSRALRLHFFCSCAHAAVARATRLPGQWSPNTN